MKYDYGEEPQKKKKQDRQTMTGTTDTGSVYPNGKI